MIAKDSMATLTKELKKMKRMKLVIMNEINIKYVAINFTIIAKLKEGDNLCEN